MSTKDEAERLAEEYVFHEPDEKSRDYWVDDDIEKAYLEGFRAGEKSERVMRLVKTMTKVSSSIVRPVSMHDACHMLAEIEKKLDSAIASFNASPEEKK